MISMSSSRKSDDPTASAHNRLARESGTEALVVSVVAWLYKMKKRLQAIMHWY